MSLPEEDIFQFPCRFPIKAMGLATEDILGLFTDILKAYQANPHPDDLVWRKSGQGKYISVTATIHATSREQLENIYQALNKDDRIRYVL
jgi:putative lipoic acid-binding regulatory protein